MAAPEATLRMTSPRHIADALQDVASEATDGCTIHICGVGCELPAVEIADALKAAGAKCSVRWYGGAEHPELAKLKASKLPGVSILFEKMLTTLSVLAGSLHLGKDKRVAELLRLDEAVWRGAKEMSPAMRQLSDLVLAANQRFYFFGDDSLNEEAVRHLAGLCPVSPRLEDEAKRYHSSGDAIMPLGSSKAMSKLRQLVGKIGPIDEPVLIQGPTGSGKEVVARALHLTSGRLGSFVAVNCAVLGGNLAMVEDRLFGHVRGAFTGADRAAKGAFEEADEGTLFLDEIGELPGEVQSQLLRVLEEKRVRPLGTMDTRRVDVRVVAATHQDLRRSIADGRFREDLYYRLEVLQIQVPPLTERPEDIRSIVAAECEMLNARGYALKLGGDDWRAIKAHHWPGNVRELKNSLRRAAYLGTSIALVLKESSALEKHAPPGRGVSGLPATIGEVASLDAVCKAYVQHVVSLFEGNITQSARALGIAPNTVRKYTQGSAVS
jgi:DNA-binding NtrC family response regulator